MAKSVSNIALQKQLNNMETSSNKRHSVFVESNNKRLVKIEDKVQQLDEDIRGNGKQGLRTEISEIKKDNEHMHENLKIIKDNGTWLLRLIGTALVGQILNLIFK